MRMESPLCWQIGRDEWRIAKCLFLSRSVSSAANRAAYAPACLPTKQQSERPELPKREGRKLSAVLTGMCEELPRLADKLAAMHERSSILSARDAPSAARRAACAPAACLPAHKMEDLRCRVAEMRGVDHFCQIDQTNKRLATLRASKPKCVRDR